AAIAVCQRNQRGLADAIEDGRAPIGGIEDDIRIVEAALDSGLQIPGVPFGWIGRVALLAGDHVKTGDTVTIRAAECGVPVTWIVSSAAFITLKIDIIAIGHAVLKVYPETLESVRNQRELISEPAKHIGKLLRRTEIVRLFVIIVDRVNSR